VTIKISRRKVRAWQFITGDGTLLFPYNGEENVKVSVGQTFTATGSIKMDHNGLHASPNALDAYGIFGRGGSFGWKPTNDVTICRVELSGEILQSEKQWYHDCQKYCASKCKVLWMANATSTLHKFALYCAKDACKLAGIDGTSWIDIETIMRHKELWIEHLEGKLVDERFRGNEGLAFLQGVLHAKRFISRDMYSINAPVSNAVNTVIDACSWKLRLAVHDTVEQALAVVQSLSPKATTASWDQIRREKREQLEKKLDRMMLALGKATKKGK